MIEYNKNQILVSINKDFYNIAIKIFYIKQSTYKI